MIKERFGSSGSTCAVNSGESPGWEVDESRVSRGGFPSAENDCSAV